MKKPGDKRGKKCYYGDVIYYGKFTVRKILRFENVLHHSNRKLGADGFDRHFSEGKRGVRPEGLN